MRWRPRVRRRREGCDSTFSAAIIAALAVVALLCIAVAAPRSISVYDPLRGNFLQGLQPPSAAHWFGTDRLGRDVLSRVVFGARCSLLIGVSAMLISVSGGVVLGLFAGLRNRFADEAISRIFDVLSAFPSVLLALLVVVFLGTQHGERGDRHRPVRHSEIRPCRACPDAPRARKTGGLTEPDRIKVSRKVTADQILPAPCRWPFRSIARNDHKLRGLVAVRAKSSRAHTK